MMNTGNTGKNPSKSGVYVLKNEHFRADLNAVWPSAIVFRQPAKTY